MEDVGGDYTELPVGICLLFGECQMIMPQFTHLNNQEFNPVHIFEGQQNSMRLNKIGFKCAQGLLELVVIWWQVGFICVSLPGTHQKFWRCS